MYTISVSVSNAADLKKKDTKPWNILSMELHITGLIFAQFFKQPTESARS
jgi:hypothetical protein